MEQALAVGLLASVLALLVAVFPANLHMALHPERYPRLPPTLLWLRLPLQPALMAWVWWATAEADGALAREDPSKGRAPAR